MRGKRDEPGPVWLLPVFSHMQVEAGTVARVIGRLTTEPPRTSSLRPFFLVRGSHRMQSLCALHGLQNRFKLLLLHIDTHTHIAHRCCHTDPHTRLVSKLPLNPHDGSLKPPPCTLQRYSRNGPYNRNDDDRF